MDGRATSISTTDTRLARRSTRRRVVVPLVALATTASVSAEALAAPPIRLPRIRIRPPVELPIPTATPQELAAARESAGRYGTGIAAVENQLDTVNDDAVRAIDEDVRHIGLTADVRARLRECVMSDLQSTAEDYGQAIVGPEPDFPGVYESFQAAATGCIQDHLGLPDTPRRRPPVTSPTASTGTSQTSPPPRRKPALGQSCFPNARCARSSSRRTERW